MRSDVYIVAVKDDALPSVMDQLVRHLPDRLIVHTAGSMPMMGGGVFYPMQSFSKERPVDFAEIPTFIEASDDKTMTVAKLLAESITERVYELSSEDRQYLHLAAVFACNFVNHCYAMAAEILEQHGMNFDVMLPLIDETARKVHQLHPLDAQTGPAIRYDENVIRHHAQLLHDHPFMKDLYERLSLHIHRKAEQHD
jgi:predicted short-subunit dehydrogenase-like oxidoreductase (DUF2520 family)